MDRFGPTRPTLRQIQYFVAVAEHGAIGKAAEALAVTQPSLSKQLVTMEEELGAVLFERTSRRVNLTPIGETLLPLARAILTDLHEFRTVARGNRGPFGDKLAIGVLPSIGAYFLPAANRRLHKRYPNLRMTVEEGATAGLLRLLREGHLDVIIATPTDDPAFETKDLFSETLWACAATDDPLSSETGPLTLADLAAKPLLSLSGGFQLTEIVERLADLAGTHVSRDYEGASLDAVRQMAVMGAGVAVLPSLYALAEAVRDPDFVVRRIDHEEALHHIALIWRATSPMKADCLELADHLIDVKQEIINARPGHLREPLISPVPSPTA